MHFTHVDNLAGITACGGLLADCTIRDDDVAINECGDVDIKERRRNTPVRVHPGGMVGHYVPFYFAPKSPMLYKIWKGGVPTYSQGQGPLVYVVSSLATVDDADLAWVGSNGNFAIKVSVHTNEWAKLESIVDWPLMTQQYWNDTEEDGDRMRRRMAELLVHKFFPFHCVEYLVAKSQRVASMAKLNTDGKIPVHVRPHWYY